MTDKGSEHQSWLRTPAGIGTIVGALITGVAAIVAALIMVNGSSTDSRPITTLSSSSKDDAVVAADRVRSCKLAHNMREDSDVVEGRIPADIAATTGETKKPQFRIFRSCDWPRPSWAQKDGYTAIRVMTLDNQFPADAPFESGTVDRFFSTCPTLEALYVYTVMGGQDTLRFVFKPDELFLANPGRAVNIQEYYNDYDFALYPNEAIVVHGSKHDLNTVRCIR